MKAKFVIAMMILIFGAVSLGDVTDTDAYDWVKYDCDAVTTGFTYNFRVLQASDLVVIHYDTATDTATTLTNVTDYAVSVTNNDFRNATGGTVTTTVTYGSTIDLIISTQFTMTQLAQMTYRWQPATVEDALDKSRLIDRQFNRNLLRCLRGPEEDDPNLVMEFGNAAARANKWAGFGATGAVVLSDSVTPTNAIVSAWGETFIDDADAATGRNTLGGGISFDVDKYASFSAAIADIGSTQGELHIYSAQAVTTDETVPSTLTLVFHNGGSLSIATTKTVTINGSVKAGLYKIFNLAGTGVVVFGNIRKEIYPQWWGTNTAAIQAALDSSADAAKMLHIIITPNLTAFDITALTIPENVIIHDYVTNSEHLIIHLGGEDGEFEITGPDPGTGVESPGLVLTNRAADGKRNPIIVGARGQGTKKRSLWALLFANYGDSQASMDAADFLIRSAQSAVYNTGTVNVTLGSKTVTGGSTVWTSALVGAILIVGEDEGEGVQNAFGIVASVTNTTTLLLESTWPGTTANTQEYMLLGGVEASGQSLSIIRLGQNGAFLKTPTGHTAKFYNPRVAAKYGYTAVFGPTRKGLTIDNSAIVVAQATEAATPGTGEAGFKWYGSTILKWIKATYDKATDYLNWEDRDMGVFLQFIPNTTQSKMDIQISGVHGLLKIPIIATASLPAAHASINGVIVIEDGGTGDRNLIIYSGGERFRIDGGSNI